MSHSNVAYLTPSKGASLLLSFKFQRRTVLIVGSGTLAASRAFAALEADAEVCVFPTEPICEELRWRAEQSQLRLLDFSSQIEGTHHQHGSCPPLDAIITHIDVERPPSLVCVTDTTIGSSARRSRASAEDIARTCRRRGIPVNVTDMPDLCDFTFMSTHRFSDSDNTASPLQIGVTTNGQGCRLASRIRREISTSLAKDAGTAVKNIGKLRSIAICARSGLESEEVENTSEENGPSTPNMPVAQRTPGAKEDELESARRRMKWVAQISEYWSYSQLAKLTSEEMTALLDGSLDTSSYFPSYLHPTTIPSTSLHGLDVPRPSGKIYLVGSGPGHPALLTVGTLALLTQHAELILTDKLVPAAILDLIPKHIEVRVARKFPGNAEGAQQEMMEAAVEGARRGLTVVRLKQGDPTVYGRAGEELLYLRAHGFEPLIVPGVSSAVAGPALANIAVTQRGAAESVAFTTGVGRAGRDVTIPGYDRARSLVVLMGVARLPKVVHVMTATKGESGRDGAAYPAHTPIAIVERASMPDQRVLLSTLEHVVGALDALGEQRPPGLIVVGWTVLALAGKGDLTVLDEGAENEDAERVRRWLEGKKWRIEEGLDERWDTLSLNGI